MDSVWEGAIKRGEFQRVLELLERGINVDSRNRRGQTALMLAAHAGHRVVVEALIARRASLNITAKYTG
jgi:ankyrin repeat protein